MSVTRRYISFSPEPGVSTSMISVWSVRHARVPGSRSFRCSAGEWRQPRACSSSSWSRPVWRLRRLLLEQVAIGHLAPVDAEVVDAGRTVADPCLVEDGGALLPVVRKRQHRADPALLAAHQGETFREHALLPS